ncbi:MAG: hypothetical protein GXO17_04130 [Thermodesulfobacteria bacterium]|nr:hypothetical protein [Thermodesulfobacteriota bacterium]
MSEIVFAGPSGSGKTLLVQGLMRELAAGVWVDGQVEVPSLSRFFEGEEKEREPFKVLVPLRNFMLCAACRLCAKNCPFKAIYEEDLWIDPLECEGCGICARNCPQKALEMANMQVGECFRLEKGDQALLYGRLMPGALGGALLAEHLRTKARNSEKKPVILEAFGLGEIAARFLEDADHAVFVVDPGTDPEVLVRLSHLAREARRYLVLNKCRPETRAAEEEIARKAEEAGIELIARLEFREDLSRLPVEEVPADLAEALSRLAAVAKE